MIFHHYCIQNVNDGIQIQVYHINESVNHSSWCILVKVKKKVRKSQAQFREKLRKLKLRQNNDVPIKKCVLWQYNLPFSQNILQHFACSQQEDHFSSVYASFVK